MPGGGGGRTETKHDLVGGAHTAAHCFPLGDAGLDLARALRCSWVLGGVLPARGGCRQVWQEPRAWKAPGTWGSGHGTQRPTTVAWTGTKRSGVQEPPVKPSVPGCLGRPHGHCWVQAVAGGPGSWGKLQAPHQQQHPLEISVTFFSPELSFSGKAEDRTTLPVCLLGSQGVTHHTTCPPQQDPPGTDGAGVSGAVG